MKRFFKYVSMAVVFVLIAGAVAGYIFIRNFDLNQYKKYAEELVYKQLGRKLSINGEANVGISLIPTLEVNDVELANPSWASQPQMVKIQQLEIKLALLPLLKKEVIIDKINLIQPEIYLEKAADGKASWDFAADKPADAAQTKVELPEAVARTKADEANNENREQLAEKIKQAGDVNPVLGVVAGFAARQVNIENGLVQYRDLKAKSLTNLRINSVAMSAESLDSNLRASFDLVYDGQVIKGQTTLGSINQFFDAKQPFPVKLDASAYGVQLNLDGSVTDAMNNPRFAFNTNVYNPAGNFNAPETTLKAAVSGTDKNVTADISALNVVNNLITGKISADIAAKVPYVKANLQSAKIDLTTLQQNKPMAFAFPELISSAQASAMVPDTPVPYSVLKSVNADAVLNVKKLIIDQAMSAENIQMTVKLNNGVLAVNPLKLDFGGGDIDANLQVNAANQSIVLKLDSKNILLQNLHKEFLVENANDFGIRSGGQTDIFADVTARGATYRQLVQNLGGQVIAIVNKSEVQTGALNFMTGNVLTQVLNMINLNVTKNPKIDLACAVVRTDLSGGKAIFPESIAIQSPQITLVSNGQVNLINDKIDFSITPSLGIKDANVAQALSSFIKVKGTIDKPQIALDDKQALQTIVGVAVTGPAFLGSQLVMESNSAPCWTALKGTRYADRFPAPSKAATATQDAVKDTKQLVKDTGKAVEKSVRDLRDGAKDILNMFKGK